MATIRSQNSEDLITSSDVAKILNRTPSTVTRMVRAGLLRGEKMGGRWMINREDIQAFSSKNAELSSKQSISKKMPLKVDAGMIEVSIALTGISAAIAALLPAVPLNLNWVKQITAVLAGLLSVYSAYSALWLLATYSLKKTSRTGIPEIWELLRASYLGPYWFMALGLSFWLMLSFLVIYIVVAGGG
jgi:excisionase family DNA binding protein